VDDLVTRLDRIVAGEPVERVVLLWGPRGVGKSRIVAEFYRRVRLARMAGGRSYWPPLLDPDSIGFDAVGNPQRPVVQVGPDPNYVRAPGALPSVFWWWTEAAQGTGADVLSALWDQLSLHLPYLADAWWVNADAKAKAVRAGSHAAAAVRGEKGSLALDGGVEGLTTALTAAEVAVPFMGPALTRAYAGARSLRARRRARAARSRGGAPRVAWPGAQAVHTQLTRVITPQVPMVLVVEDLQQMGVGMAALLDYLAQPLPDTPVLVVATVSPEATERVGFRYWHEDASDPARSPALVARYDIPALGHADLVRLASRFAPDAPAALVDPVAARWPNPEMVCRAMFLSSVGGQIRAGRPVPDQALNSSPDPITALTSSSWAELPLDTRAVLMMAAGTLPPSADPGGGSGPDARLWPILNWAIARAADQAGLHPREHVFPELRKAVAAGWLTAMPGVRGLVRFADPDRADVALAALTQAEGPNAQPNLRQATIAVLGPWLARGPEGPRTVNDPTALVAARWLLALTGGPATGIHGVVDAARVIAHAHAAFLEYEAAVGMLNAAVSPARVDWSDPVHLSDQHTLATWTWVIGQRTGDPDILRDALGRLERVLQHRDTLLGRRDPTTTKTRRILARWHSDIYQYQRSIALYLELIDDLGATLGPDHPDTLISRNNLAGAYESAGDLGRAIPLYEQTLTDRVRVLGPDHPQTLASRNNLADARLLGQAADPAHVLDVLGAAGAPPDVQVCVRYWVGLPMPDVAMYALSALLAWHRPADLRNALAATAEERRPADRVAALRLVETGFGVHEVRLFAGNRWAAERAALNAITEQDGEDLDLIITVNPQLRDSPRGVALRILDEVVEGGPAAPAEVGDSLGRDGDAPGVANALEELRNFLPLDWDQTHRIEAILRALSDP
jgi:hypothetical protein